MFRLSKRTAYAQIAAKHLASDRGRPWSANNIRETQGLRTEPLARRFLRLVRSGLHTSQHGTNGGYILAQHPMCVTTRGECAQASKCPAWEPIRMINKTIEQALGMLMIPRLSEESPHLVHSGGLTQ
jgi:hypothetical protein